MGKTTIEWTATQLPDGTWAPGYTFNPWIGCTKVSAGCKNCYAERQDHHRKWTPQGWGAGQLRRRTSASNWKQPLKWNREAGRLGVRYRVFCASLADVFDPEVPDEWRDDLFHLIAETPHLNWLLLTKRPEEVMPFLWRMGDDKPAALPKNAWLGVSVEDQEQANIRIPVLLQIPASLRFLSCEPLLGPIDLWCIQDGSWHDCEGADYYDALKGSSFWSNGDYGIGGGPVVDWVIVGGESGPKARTMHLDWVRSLRDQCARAGTPFLFKQWGKYCRPDQAPEDTFVAWDAIHNAAGNPDLCKPWPFGKKASGNYLDYEQHLEFPPMHGERIMTPKDLTFGEVGRALQASTQTATLCRRPQ